MKFVVVNCIRLFTMAPAADYLFLSIETLINTISIIVMIPCMITLVKTQGMHGNCKILLVTSGTVQILVLLVQCTLFVYDFAIENLIHYGAKEFGFHYAQNALFAISTMFAVWNAAKYESRKHHLIPLFILLCGSLPFAFLIVYANYFLLISDKTIYVFYVFEGFTLLVSIVIIVYARHKLMHMPYDQDRLKAKYQITEVLKFSVAILPSVILSVFMHTFSLVPTFLWQHGLLTWPECCLIYFSVHSVNCIVTKAALIACHAGMRHRFKLIFNSQGSANHEKHRTRRQRLLFSTEIIYFRLRSIFDAIQNITDVQYLFLSIEMFVNTISLIVMVPFMITLVRTQGMHDNCKILLVTSGAVQLALLIVQCALYVYDFIIGNLTHDPESGFLFAQNGLFSMATYISLVLVLERTFAVWNAAEYETTEHHFVALFVLLSGSLGFAAFVIYMNYWLFLNFYMIFVFYAIEGVTFVISIVIIIYARQKLNNLPYDEDRLKAKYQVTEVLKFSVAILPSVILSVIMHTFSLIPTFLWQQGVIRYPLCCVFYFSVHSLSCIVTKFTLIFCHKGMRQRFQLLFIARLSTPTGARIKRDTEKEGIEYFDKMKATWDGFTEMAPASDYLFLSVETFINSISLIIMIPCLSTVIRTQGMHGNCKLILVTSAGVNSLILCVQTALFAFNFITENLMPITDAKERPFLYMQNTLFTMSSYVSIVLVLERVYAVRNAAQYEKCERHLIPLFILITGCLAMAMLHVYVIYWHNWFFQSIAMTYAVEGCTLIISIVIIIYARHKLKHIPYDGDRLKAKYQIREVLNFSIAILPSVIVSSVMHTLSLVPTLLWINGVINYSVCCVFYFTVHSINCIFTKMMLIVCHRGMRERFQRLFVSRLSTPKGARVIRDTEKEGKEYFDQMKASWDGTPVRNNIFPEQMRLCLLLICTILLIGNDAMRRPIAPAKLLGYKHLNATELVKAIADDEKNEGGKVALYCQYAFCHGLENIMNCDDHCANYAIFVGDNEKQTYKQRVTKLDTNTKPASDVHECTKVCESDCGSNYIVCEALCQIHFSFGNRKEYEVELNTFIGRLRND
ncbi:hypothetical protein PRIPAC_71218 [Pristionchus pacificus]|uniref:G protein-coupled receptor n=1 Tax=Pristionchus pacificus TaxID=54126 RepID=A0A2A6C1Q2_PRIPA|nr:hypothetical protein PRIPAC_71218 [Pristionchus pacificus]|eukprot:PDM71953.1 G protein-coupled receptor [Pristionchus pacificus]